MGVRNLTLVLIAVAVAASFVTGAVLGNQVRVIFVEAIAGTRVLVPDPGLVIRDVSWQIDPQRSLVTGLILFVFATTEEFAVFQIFVQVSCLFIVNGQEDPSSEHICSTGESFVFNPGPFGTHVNVNLLPPINPETIEIHDLSFIVKGLKKQQDLIIDADGTASAGDGIPGAVDVFPGAPLSTFPDGPAHHSGLDWFDQDGNGVWTFGVNGDDLQLEDEEFCPGATRDGSFTSDEDCKVLDLNGDLVDGAPVSCDVEVGFNFAGVPACPDPGMKYFDADGDGAYDNGEDIVFDANGNGVFD